MTLQPTLIALVGPETTPLSERLPRWFAPLRHVYRGMDDPLPVVAVAGDGSGLSGPIERLRSSSLLQKLREAGIAPPTLTTFRTILAVDASRWEEALDIITKIGTMLDELPFGSFPSRQFWIVATGPSTIEEVRRFHGRIAATPSEGQSIVVFSLMPSWRGTVPSPANLLTAAERVAALLALADAHPASPLTKFLNARHSTVFTVGLEAYRLAGFEDAVSASVLAALEKFVTAAISGTPPDTGTLVRIVRECCPAFDIDAAIPASTPEAERKRREYLQNYVPKLLERLAGYSPNLSAWFGLLERVRANVRTVDPVPPQTVQMISLYPGIAIIAVLLALVLWVLKRVPNPPSLPPPEPAWKPHPVLFDSLSMVVDDLQDLLNPSPVRPRLYDAGSEFTELLGETLSKVERRSEAAESAFHVLQQHNLTLIVALAAGWLTGETTPVSACEAAVRVKNDCCDAARKFLLQRWVEGCLNAHSETGNIAGNHLFSPAQPGGAEWSFLLAGQSIQTDWPNPQVGLYPDNFLHFLYLIAH